MNKISGPVLLMGDDINTDIIIAGKYCKMADPSELARHVLEDAQGNIRASLKRGTVIAAGRNFGCGSSREQAPLALKGAGVRAIVAESFARIFYRNCINIGLPLMVCPGARRGLKKGDRITLDLGMGLMNCVRTGKTEKGEMLPTFLLQILSDGGLIPHLKREMRSRGKI